MGRLTMAPRDVETFRETSGDVRKPRQINQSQNYLPLSGAGGRIGPLCRLLFAPVFALVGASDSSL